MKSSSTLMVIAAGAFGAALGLGTYTFVYAKGWAYLTNDPRACANCHVMNEQYDGWILGEAIDYVRQGQLALRPAPVPVSQRT